MSYTALRHVARVERSRLHRLAVRAAHAPTGRAVDDRRVYRCRGCGDWRYRWTGARVNCPACGTRGARP